VRARALIVTAAITVCALSVALRAQPTSSPSGASFTIERTSETASVTFFNRPITVLRARIVGRSPSERAGAAVRLLDALVQDRVTSPVEERQVGAAIMIAVAGRSVLLLTPDDVDELEGETLGAAANAAAANLRLALAEADEARTPGRLLAAATMSAVGIALGAALLWVVGRLRRRAGERLVAAAERKIAASGIASLDTLHTARVVDVERYIVTAIFTLVDLAIIYGVVGFVLREFPYTRPWGESMRGFVLGTVEHLGRQALDALPGLFTVVLIFGVTRLVIRLSGVWFRAVEQGQVQVTWLHPDTVQPTRRLVATLLWVFAVIVAYPYMPGSQTEAFKGVSVFLGLILTLGSSGLVNQIMSGFMITYSRALRVGDFVKVGDVEGTVTHVGVLSTKVMSLKHEEVTIPNAVVVATTTTDYSRYAGAGMFTTTSVTIGYDTPWRQIHAMLLQAAARTKGLRADPKPIVLQEGLEDFYVKYTLWVSLDRQEERPFVLDVLHANIQDLFNEYGVQIMSPNYVLDPTAPKVVPKEQWFAKPADKSGASGA
jgi:small-conductance mechanosensitive channel